MLERDDAAQRLAGGDCAAVESAEHQCHQRIADESDFGGIVDRDDVHCRQGQCDADDQAGEEEDEDRVEDPRPSASNRWSRRQRSTVAPRAGAVDGKPGVGAVVRTHCVNPSRS